MSPRLLLPALLAAALVTLPSCGTDLDAELAKTQVAEPTDAPPTAPEVDPPTARDLVEDGAVLVDVRGIDAFEKGHLVDALHLDLQSVDFLDELADLDRDERYVVYGRSAATVAAATTQMLSLGFTDVVNAGGHDSLESAGLPAE